MTPKPQLTEDLVELDAAVFAFVHEWYRLTKVPEAQPNPKPAPKPRGRALW